MAGADSASLVPPPVRGDAKMRLRLSALMRKAGISAALPDAAALMDTLLLKLHTKRDYEDALGTPVDADRFARAHCLPEAQHHMLLELQNQKDIFTPNALLDFVFTLFFFVQVVLVGWTMMNRDLLWLFLLLLILIDAVIVRVNGLSKSLGLFLSRKLVDWGCLDVEPLNGREQFKKWQEQSWQLFVHVIATCVEAYILHNETWWYEPVKCYVPHPLEKGGEQRMDLHILYLVQLAVWMYTCLKHRFVDERRKDYFVMYLHHIVTIALVGMSWINGYLRIGLLVLYVHDVSDVFVDLLKLSNYLKLEGPRSFFATEIAYVATVSGWMYWRLYQFPVRVLWASFTGMLRVTAPSASSPHTFFGFSFSTPDMPLIIELYALLTLLLVLHVYWFHLFAMVGYRILTENVREASRQEYEGDSGADSSKPPSSPGGARRSSSRSSGERPMPKSPLSQRGGAVKQRK